MERNNRRRLRESGIPLDTIGPMHAFAIGTGPGDGEHLQLIPREDWPKEIAAMAAEESEFWRGSSVSMQLAVELPFWLMIPDGEVRVAHGRTTIQASVTGQYMAVHDGPLFHDSRLNVIFIGPNKDLKVGKEPPPIVAASQAPIYRPMKTVVIFRTTAIEGAIQALQQREAVTQRESHASIRRVNRAAQYLESLAYAHVPILNHLITSYRLASRDPFAFHVSGWDVPVWFAIYDDKLVRICLMPYSDRDWYPTLRRFGQEAPVPFHAASPDDLQAQGAAEVAPGTLEIQDAQSLLYRGHVDDAVRSAITAIEVALEAQIRRLLIAKGWGDQQIEGRLAETWNDFDNRLADYERVSGTRIPGPILSCLPHVNGIRLKSELSRVRRLRHKIVHEGLRVDYHSRGPMVRAIETMTWLFNWLSWQDGRTEDRSRAYILGEMMRGMHIPAYPSEYCDSGIVVLPRPADGPVATAQELLRSQYLASIEGEASDIELFALMSFASLGIDAVDTSPPPDRSVVHERYYINDKEHHALVFCLECDGLVDADVIEAVANRLREGGQCHATACSALCIINHRKDRPVALREVEGAIPDDANRLANECGITLITATDLRFLVQGAMDYRWDLDPVKNLLFIPGRQGAMPPAYRRIGTCAHFFGNLSVMSVELQPAETVETGMVVGVRLGTQYHEGSIQSLQVNHEDVSAATGPARVGIKTELHRSDLSVGQAVFVRTA